ncbi:hypothetical protein DICVIV_02843 [Dictyocaulus viviparus]|uniref:Uncharacterized protein n=1 Tax=Dictyocaulus viviparus TaxID=29172 RepID=A0A0D8Y2Q3_DICVI|nr:hypothetical protein DICVIV_02843 [Dictyocaulus viviparus]
MFENFAYDSASISDWQQAAVTVTENRYVVLNQIFIIGLMLHEWFSRKTRPVLLVTVTSKAINVEVNRHSCNWYNVMKISFITDTMLQVTTDLWSVPVEVIGSGGTQLFTVTNRSTILPFSSNDYVIADPERKSAAMIIYDVNSYHRIILCWDDSQCPVKRSSLRGIIRDLAAVLLADKLQPPRITDVPKWKAIFKFARKHQVLTGNAACCAEYAISRRVEIACIWISRDICEKIRFLKAITVGI